ncbi:hypothetical protein RclHR1_22210003 [Rhizophagus clarus]|uniref:Uncharacterized protein n=1 Tax=Rhizophagus clarus TaxID=94130 RepID=A0A2Z6R7M3_9GLOM|nr:hypothetical protein RclHR1_22210003 [Rhizophagus clarus]
MNLVGECWMDYSYFKLLDNITSNIKSSFVHSSARKRRWISYLSTSAIRNPTLPPFFEIPEELDNSSPNITLPPLPVKTRWCSWFRFVFWLSNYIPYIVSFFIEEERLDNSSKAICDLGRTFQDFQLVFNFEIMVLFIKCNANRFVSDLEFFKIRNKPLAAFVANRVNQTQATLEYGANDPHFHQK